METYKIIWSLEEMQKFYNILPELTHDEGRLVSLSARKKYLTDEQKEKYNLNRAEMFARSIIRQNDFKKFSQIIKRYECNVEGYTTKSGLPYPQNALVCYMNVNPSAMLRAYSEFSKNVGLYQYELIASLLKKDKKQDDLMVKLRKLDVGFLNAIQRAKSKRQFLDIDFDIDKEKELHLLEEFIEYLNEKEITYYVIETHGGYHVLLKKDTIGKNNFYDRLKPLNFHAEKEIILNQNGMIPVPGTLHGLFEVKILKM
jgi:hypothetical protein